MDNTLQLHHPDMATYKEDECIAALAYADYAFDLSAGEATKGIIGRPMGALEEAIDNGESRICADTVDTLLVLADPPPRGQTEIGESAQYLLYKAGHCLDEARKVL